MAESTKTTGDGGGRTRALLHELRERGSDSLVFASDHPLRGQLVRVGAALLAVAFIVWAAAFATGITGLGSMPGLGKDDADGSASARQAEDDGPTAMSGDEAEATTSETARGAREDGSGGTGSGDATSVGAPGQAPTAPAQSRPQTGSQPQSAPTSPTTSPGSPTTSPGSPSTETPSTGTPELTPGGNSPGASRPEVTPGGNVPGARSGD